MTFARAIRNRYGHGNGASENDSVDPDRLDHDAAAGCRDGSARLSARRFHSLLTRHAKHLYACWPARLSKSADSRAITSPSPPLLPGPHRITIFDSGLKCSGQIAFALSIKTIKIEELVHEVGIKVRRQYDLVLDLSTEQAEISLK